MKILQFPKKIINFLKEVKEEMGKVNWPTKREVFKNTLIVTGISVVLAAFLGGLDFLFTNLLNKLIL
ncbi:MAG: preprotein translocase subunit SecE [Candidatus Nealsonbacteria bacterium CG_4_10_14_0_8_um_filter_35_10]|uniref:Protein translocase subunit SecE n=2 Tax=Candidatus Nealsoniibacteriota TaxID=1817911 RepID=A0A2M7R7Z4_9BACT|nr:MAG: preprotein translocase subunit SecE [Parcubacteria group bacterium CG1_02_36_42]PIY90931.1 MAG: preprotein translocase subunit SecE [Candidatus Nealsonbacteria bacterium CG_4_10_14_0_8_um_filter_35_10]PJB99523.1 MAG: preprotein translocase subunit SecE [Candidatus Nealsonbacteria bacterium CG_4_9_14_0_8_um_filter_35_12]